MNTPHPCSPLLCVACHFTRIMNELKCLQIRTNNATLCSVLSFDYMWHFGNAGIGLEQDILFLCFICKFKTALYTYSSNLWKKPCYVFGCIWCMWFALYLIIMGLLTKLLEKPTFIMCCFRSEMKVLLKKPQCAEFIFTYVWLLKRFSCMVTVLLCSGWISKNRYYYSLFVRLVEDWLRSAVCIVPKRGR